jgi:hypothetical protein
MGNQAAEQLVGGDRCLTRQLVSAGPSHRRLLGPGSTMLYVGLITRRSQVRSLSPLPERRSRERLFGSQEVAKHALGGMLGIARNLVLHKRGLCIVT